MKFLFILVLVSALLTFAHAWELRAPKIGTLKSKGEASKDSGSKASKFTGMKGDKKMKADKGSKKTKANKKGKKGAAGKGEKEAVATKGGKKDLSLSKPSSELDTYFKQLEKDLPTIVEKAKEDIKTTDDGSKGTKKAKEPKDTKGDKGIKGTKGDKSAKDTKGTKSTKSIKGAKETKSSKSGKVAKTKAKKPSGKEGASKKTAFRAKKVKHAVVRAAYNYARSFSLLQ